MLGADLSGVTPVAGSVRLSRATDGDGEALFDAYFSAGKFRYRGASYNDVASFLGAIGGVQAGIGCLIGPYVAPDAAEILVNGDFSAGTASWSVGVHSGTILPTIAVVGGELELNGNESAFPALVQGFTALPGRAYRLKGRRRRGASGALSPAIGFGRDSKGVSPELFSQSTNATGTSFVGAELYCGGLGATPHVIGRCTVATAIGLVNFADFSLREALPYPGFVAGEVGGVIEATTPAATGGDKVLWQADDNAEHNGGALERNFIRLVWDDGKHLRMIVTGGGAGVLVQHANLDLGIIEPAMPFEVVFSAALNAFRAALVGQPAKTDIGGAFPGVAMMRIGRGRLNDSVWDGGIARVTIFPSAKNAAEFDALASGTQAVVAWGDSLTSGAGVGVEASYPAVASSLFTPARAVTGLGIGGYTSTQVAARMNAHPILVSVAGDAIPASGSVAVTAKTTNVLQNTGVFTGAETGTLADVPGTMSTDAEGNWTFTRARPGGARYCPAGSQFVTDWGALLRHRIAWLWGGRNGALAGHGVEEDIAVAVASLGHDRYLVGSVLTAASDNAGRISEFQALNLSLKTTYGSRFVDVYDALRAAVDGSPEDAADVAAGLTPRSKRSDAIHLNAVGYALVASCFQMATIGHGW